MSERENGVEGGTGGGNGSAGSPARRPRVSRRAFVAGAGAASVAAWARRATAQGKPTITYWNGLTGADGKVMDELIDQFTRDSGIRIEQQRLPWADLYAKLQVAVPAGEGPDLALIHTVEVPHFASDGVLEAIDDATTTAKGFRADDYLPATWQGGTYQGKRYSLPLDVPQHILYLNTKVMKEAGLVGADGRPRVPGSRDELVTMAKRIASKPETFGFAIGTVGPGRYTWGFHNLLWQNGANIYAADLKKAAVAEPAALEVAEFWAALEGQHKIAPPANANCRDAFIAGKLGMWIAGSWNFTGLREAKVEFTAAPLPRLFKQPVVWAMPHQYTFPKAKAADRDQAGRGVGPRALDDRPRGGVDAQGRPGLGQPQGALRRAHHRRSGPARAAVPGAAVAGRAADAQVGRGGEPHPPGDRGGLHRAEAGQGRDGGSGAPDQRAPRLA